MISLNKGMKNTQRTLMTSSITFTSCDDYSFDFWTFFAFETVSLQNTVCNPD